MCRAITRHSSVDGATRVFCARLEMVYPRDVAVRQESTQLALETIHEIERGLGGLRRVLTSACTA